MGLTHHAAVLLRDIIGLHAGIKLSTYTYSSETLVVVFVVVMKCCCVLFVFVIKYPAPATAAAATTTLPASFRYFLRVILVPFDKSNPRSEWILESY